MAFVHLFYGFGYFFIHHRTSIGSFTESFVKIQPDLAEIRIRKLDWRDGGKKKGWGGILLCNGLMDSE